MVTGRIAHRESLTRFLIFHNELPSEPSPFAQLDPKATRSKASGSRQTLAVNKRLAFLEQLRKLPFLLGDAIRSPRLVLSARKGGGLLGEFSDIVAGDGDARVKFFKRAMSH
jgi:hypothetical protein